MHICVSVHNQHSLRWNLHSGQQLNVQSKQAECRQPGGAGPLPRSCRRSEQPDTRHNRAQPARVRGQGDAHHAGTSGAAILALVSPHEALQAGHGQASRMTTSGLSWIDAWFAFHRRNRPARSLETKAATTLLPPRNTCIHYAALAAESSRRLPAAGVPAPLPPCIPANGQPTHPVEFRELVRHVLHVLLWRQDGGAHVEGAGLLRGRRPRAGATAGGPAGA